MLLTVVNEQYENAPHPASICQTKMELAEMADCVLFADPVRPLAFLAKTALEVMIGLYQEAIVCLMECEPITTTAVCTFDLCKIQSSKERTQRNSMLKYYHNPVDCKIAPSTLLAMLLQFERVTPIGRSRFPAGPIIGSWPLDLIRLSIRWSRFS